MLKRCFRILKKKKLRKKCRTNFFSHFISSQFFLRLKIVWKVCSLSSDPTMCWNEWKYNFPIHAIFIFRVIVKIHRNWQFLEQKWRKMTITRKSLKFDFYSNLFSRFRIFHVNFTTFHFFILDFDVACLCI